MAIEATRRNAAHLLRRGAWGGTPDDIDRVATLGIEAAVEAMFDPADAPELAEPAVAQGVVPYDEELFNLWFYGVAVNSPTPAIERLMWFWHGHFATSLAKVEFPDLLLRQLVTLRRLGLGRFDDLLAAMVLDPAMILWLDLHLSIAGRPNENFARELMELFSMGASNGYTQRDVVEAARALTGYSLRYHPGTDRVVGVDLNPALHDDGPKTVLGRRGNFDGVDVASIIVERPECHRFVAERFWLRYAGTRPGTAALDDLTAALAERFVVRDLLVAMLTHPDFYSDAVHGALVTQPVEIMVRTLRNFGLRVPDVAGATWETLGDDADAAMVVESSFEMGQAVGHPPNVAGWPHNEPWLDSNRAAGRLVAGLRLGEWIAWTDNDVVRGLGALLGRPRRFAEALLSQFGVVEWTADTVDAIASSMTTGEPDTDLAAAVAVAFTSPEVTLA